MTKYEVEQAIFNLNAIAETDPDGEIFEAFVRYMNRIVSDSYFKNKGKFDTRSIEELRRIARRVGGHVDFGDKPGFSLNEMPV